MNETQTTKPELETFAIYRDGQLDKFHEIKRYATFTLKSIGHVAYVGLEATINALDEFVQSAQ